MTGKLARESDKTMGDKTKMNLDEIIKRHTHKFGVNAAEAQKQMDRATKVFGAEAARSIAARAGELDYEDYLTQEGQAEFEAQHDGAVTEDEAEWNAKSDYEKAYQLFEEGWSIPDVAESIGIRYDVAEHISNRELHDRAVERHDPANCPWCREHAES